MVKNNAIIKKEEISPLVLLNEERTLSIDVATEMSSGYNLVIDIIKLLQKDNRVDNVTDDDGNIIGTKTHIHPQLLKWVREARQTRNDIWKIGGGEIHQEAEKKKLEIKKQLIMKLLDTSPKEREKMMKKWKSNTSFKK